MAEKIVIPKDNANDSSVIITQVYSHHGASVKAGELLFEYETSKTVVEVTCKSDGLLSLNVQPGDTIDVGVLAAIVDNVLHDFQKQRVLASETIETGSDYKNKFSFGSLKLIEENNLSYELFNDLVYVTSDDVLKFIGSSSDNRRSFLSEKIKFNDNSLILYGAGHQCKVVIDLIRNEGLPFDVAAAVDANSDASFIDDVPVFRTSELKNIVGLGFKNIHVCIGDGKVKSEVASMLVSMGFDIAKVIAKSSWISNTSVIGSGSYIGSNVYIGHSVNIGPLVQINHNVSIAHDSVVQAGAFLADGCIIGGSVNIGSHSSLGLGVIVNRDINIGEQCTVPSGSTITSDIAQHTAHKALLKR